MSNSFSVSPTISALDDTINSTISSGTYNKISVLEQKIGDLYDKIYRPNGASTEPKEVWRERNRVAYRIKLLRHEITQIQADEAKKVKHHRTGSKIQIQAETLTPAKTQQDASVVIVTDDNGSVDNINKDSQVDIYV